jgi:subtilase-type serine protease
MARKQQLHRSQGSTTKVRPSRTIALVLAPVLSLPLLAIAGSPAHAQSSFADDCAQFSYPDDPGFVATSPAEVDAAKASWETPEYGFYTGHNPSTPGTAVNAPWQLVAVNASTAYALGYCGQGVTLGMMDSGYRPTHESFQTELIEPVAGEGVYGTSGYGYRGAIPSNPFTAGEWFTVAGDQARTSDYSHGTGMLGVTSGIRDGIEQHGIAFGSKMEVAKTGGSDSQSHGPFHDYRVLVHSEQGARRCGRRGHQQQLGLVRPDHRPNAL